MAALPDLATPCLLLERAKLEANRDRMLRALGGRGVQLRPHVKTAKSAEVQQVVDATRGPITVSTLREAERFADAGWRDILYAVGLVPAKVPQVMALRARGIELSCILDDADAAREVAQAVADLGGIDRLPVLIEIDSDGHRAGVAPDDVERLVAIGRALGTSHTRLAGVMTHAGASYGCRGSEALAAMAEQERAAVVRAADHLEAAGLPCRVRSVGSTPTALFAAHHDGITEVRAGVYVFQDLVMAGIGVCAPEDIAVSVLATVIGHQPTRGRVVLDAGWMALSRDRGTASQPVDQGYGLLRDLHGAPLHLEGENAAAELVVQEANQEHGIAGRRDGQAVSMECLRERLPVGTRVRVLPNHACATAAQHEGYHVLDAQGRVEGWFSRFGGW